MTREEFQALISDMNEAELTMLYEALLSLRFEREGNPLPHPKDQPR